VAVIGLGRLRRHLTWLIPSVPIACAAGVIALAVYALFFRQPAAS
jgi:hypothetical protein